METLTAVHAFALTAGLAARQKLQKDRRAIKRESEIVFEVTGGADGGYSARSLTGAIVTQAESFDQLRANIRLALKALYFDRENAPRVRLHVVRDERVVLSSS